MSEDQSKYTVDVMKILIEHGSNVNEEDVHGLTPLFWADNANTEWTWSIVKFLREQGAVESEKDLCTKFFNEMAIN